MIADADPRFSLFLPEPATPRPTPAPAHRLGSSPARFHKIHGAIAIDRETELRVTSQPARQFPTETKPARLMIRTWVKDRHGEWWPLAHDRGIILFAPDVLAFARAVAIAAACIESDQGVEGEL